MEEKTRFIELTGDYPFFGVSLPAMTRLPVGKLINGAELTDEMANELIGEGFAVEAN